jgi:rubrerythrin
MNRDEPPTENAAPAIASVAELYAYLHAIEAEAGERYADLADQMEVHNNREVAALFRKLAEIEGKHASKILERAGAASLPPPKAGPHRWIVPEGLETTAFEGVHYLMTPYHALRLALHNERRAETAFRRLAESALDEQVRALAREIAAEEGEHVALIEAWLKRQPRPDIDWADDPDPPVYSE